MSGQNGTQRKPKEGLTDNELRDLMAEAGYERHEVPVVKPGISRGLQVWLAIATVAALTLAHWLGWI